MSDENVNPETVNQAPEQVPEVPAPEAPKPETNKRQMSFTQTEEGVIVANFGEGIDPLTLAPLDVPETLQAAAMTEGLVSRLRGYTSKLEGDARTPEALREAIAKGMDNLRKGIWKIERAAGEAEFTVEVEAAWVFRKMRAAAQTPPIDYTETIEQVAEVFGKLTDEQKKQLKALPRYQLAMAQVKAERAAKKQAELAAKLDKQGEDVGF